MMQRYDACCNDMATVHHAPDPYGNLVHCTALLSQLKIIPMVVLQDPYQEHESPL